MGFSVFKIVENDSVVVVNMPLNVKGTQGAPVVIYRENIVVVDDFSKLVSSEVFDFNGITVVNTL